MHRPAALHPPRLLIAVTLAGVAALVAASGLDVAAGPASGGRSAALADAQSALTLQGDDVPAVRSGNPLATQVPSGAPTATPTMPPSAAGPPTSANPAPSQASTVLGGTLLPASESVSSQPMQPAGYVTRCGDQLCLGGKVWTFTGLNAYEAATDWGVNAGCGADLSDTDLDTLFSSLGPGKVVRFWAFQALATNYTTKQLDWAPIDRVIDTAAEYGDMVIPALTNETGSCDDNEWKDANWYDGGYMDVYDSSAWPNSTPLSFWDYMQAFLQRYKDDPTIAMIELVSEPSPTESGYACINETQAAQALRSFFDTVGAEAHSLAPNLLVESGLQGSNQCGSANSDYGYVMASPGVDVASVHDYDTALTPDYFTGAVAGATADGKPLITGEVGEDAQANLNGCPSLSDRTSFLGQVMTAQFGAGSSGFLAWDWVPSNPGNGACSTDIGPGDPLIEALAAG
jgi:mannan endo-1,4-beta-mannosidase